MSTFEVCPGKHSRTKNYISDGFTYFRTKSNEKNIYLKCVSYFNKSGQRCTASAKIDVASDRLIQLKPHNHQVPTQENNVTKFKEIVKNRVRENPHLSARTIFNDVSQENPEAARHVSYKMIESTLQKIKLSVRPTNPSTIEEYVEKLSQNEELSPYFRGTITEGNETTGVLFSTEKLSTALELGVHAAFDGTFFVCPKLFGQVFTLFTANGNHFFPAFVAIMKNRKQKSYQSLFQKIQELAPGFTPEFVISDFEKASRKSFKAVWPNAQLSGCYFHFSQSILRKVKQIGLLPLFRRNSAFKKWTKALMAFSLLPENHFDSVFQILENQTFDGLSNIEKNMVQKFKAYFKRTWLTPSVKNQLSVFKKPFTTNNGSESFHAQFKKHFISPQPNIWAFTSQLGKILEANGLDYERLENGLQITRAQKKKVAKNLARRQRAQDKLEQNKITPLQYLYQVSHTLDSLVVRQTENDGGISDEDDGVELEEEAQENMDIQAVETSVPGSECDVCTERYTETWVFIPCGHGSLCPDCSSLFSGDQRPCPHCRQPITSRLRVFL